MIGKIITLLFLSSIFVALMMHTTKQEASNSLHFQAFKNWIREYSATFGDDEFQYRLQVFTENLNKINQHNQENNEWFMSLNQFAAMTHEEFVSTQLGLINVPQSENIQTIEGTFNGDVDWRQKGAVSPVKNQGQCGSCWAFSAVGNVEGVSAIFGGGLQTFSEQQLVDCSGSYGNQGCNGGWMDYAFQYVIDKGIQSEASYPYTGVQGSCKSDSGPFKVKSFTDVPAGDCATLNIGIQVEPIAIAVDANNWQFYGGGVFKSCGTSLDHGVLLVGQTSSFNIVKNSWAKSWGEQGYIRLALGNTCGMCNAASWTNLK